MSSELRDKGPCFRRTPLWKRAQAANMEMGLSPSLRGPAARDPSFPSAHLAAFKPRRQVGSLAGTVWDLQSHDCGSQFPVTDP